MREYAVIGVFSSAVFFGIGYFYFLRPHMNRRRTRIAEEEVKILLRGKELRDASESSKTTAG